jgi:DnaJ-domain-containing protein 1
MSHEQDDKIIRHLRRQEWPLTAWLFGSIQLDQRYFESNDRFSTALECIEDIETITHFNHDDPFLESDDDSEELVDANYHPTIEYVRKFKRVRAPIPFIAISTEDNFLILTPVRYWSFLDGEYSCGDTNKLDFECFKYEVKLTSPRSHDEILQETWKHATKSGDRDMRYKDNFSASLVQRHGVALILQNGSKWEFGGLLEAEWDPLIQAFQNIINQEFVDDLDENDQNDEEYEEVDETSTDDQGEEYESESWYEVLGLSPAPTTEEILAIHEEFDKLAESETEKLNNAREEGLDWARSEATVPWYEVLDVSPHATADEVKAAHRDKIKQYHPDRVSSLGEKLRLVAEQESKKLNAAKEEGLGRSQQDNDTDDTLEDENIGDEGESDEFWWDILGLSPDVPPDIDIIEWAHTEKKRQLDEKIFKLNTALCAAYDYLDTESTGSSGNSRVHRS